MSIELNRHVQTCQELFSAARAEFKHLEFYYFHNFIYESVWKDNRRRFSERIPTYEMMNTYGRDYKVIFVGDASMAPWEINYAGGSVEHYNEESGQVWMERVMQGYDKLAWINPVPEKHWKFTQSTEMIQEMVEEHMFPLTIRGLEDTMRYLAR